MATARRSAAIGAVCALAAALSACAGSEAKSSGTPIASTVAPSTPVTSSAPIAQAANADGPTPDAADIAEIERLTKVGAYLQQFEKARWYGEYKGMTFEGDVLVINTPLPPDSDRSDELSLEICNALAGFRLDAVDAAASAGIGGLQVRGANEEVLAQRRPDGAGC